MSDGHPLVLGDRLPKRRRCNVSIFSFSSECNVRFCTVQHRSTHLRDAMREPLRMTTSPNPVHPRASPKEHQCGSGDNVRWRCPRGARDRGRATSHALYPFWWKALGVPVAIGYPCRVPAVRTVVVVAVTARAVGRGHDTRHGHPPKSVSGKPLVVLVVQGGDTGGLWYRGVPG